MSRSNKHIERISDADIEWAKGDIVGTISKYIDLTMRGSEYRALCPFHSERTPSFTVSPDKGIFYCFGCGAGGDAIDFVQLYEDVSFPDAVKIIAGGETGDVKPVVRQARELEADDEWVPVSPIPADVSVVPMDIWNYRSGGSWVKIKSSMRWPYFDAEGRLLGYTYRFDLPKNTDGRSGGKEIIPQAYCKNTKSGQKRWKWQSFGKPRPIYGLEKLAAHPNAQVLIVEGEKTCEAAQVLFEVHGVTRDKLVTVSWPGGGKAARHVDWEPLAGRSVGLLPDADKKLYVAPHPNVGQIIPFTEQPGTVCMIEIAEQLGKIANSIKFIMPPLGVPDGWDLADPLPEGFELLKHMRSESILMHEFRKLHDLDPLPSVKPEASTITAHKNSTALIVADEDEDQRRDPEGADLHVHRPKLVAVPTTSSSAQVAVRQNGLKPASEVRIVADLDDIALDAPFRILGYDHEDLFIFSYERKQVIRTSISKLSREAGLIELADLTWWERRSWKEGKGFKPIFAANWVARIAERRGVYDPGQVRGRGAWDDSGRHVFHLGDRLIVDGEMTAITALSSRFVYEARPYVAESRSTPLGGQEGADLLRVATLFRWESAGAAQLLMGWIFLAPICGILKWRPHVWISAAPGVGKSTLMNEFIKPLMLDGWALCEQGLSTEAALRQKLRADARPVLLDEFECNTESDRRRIESLLTLIRISSSSGEISRGTIGGRAITFTANSMFCLASVGVGLHRQSDQSRITRLELTKNGGSTDQWDKLGGELVRIKKDTTLSQRLFARALGRLSMVRESVEIFTKEAVAHFKSHREGDQYGTMLAGCWCLTNDSVPTAQDAQNILRANNWADLGAGDSSTCDDSRDALNALLCAPIRLDSGQTRTVCQLIEIVCVQCNFAAQNLPLNFDVTRKEAHHHLQLHGIRVECSSGKENSGEVLFANRHSKLTSLISGTDYASDLPGRLARLPGARKPREGEKKSKFRFGGTPLRYIAVPLDLCRSKDDVE